MGDAEDDEVLAAIRPSATRRVFGVGVLGALGLLLIYIAFARPPAVLLLQLFLLALGLTSVWCADMMRRATAEGLELTRTRLRTTGGVILAEVDEMESLDRSMFAFKPSNGFLLRLNTKKPRGWAPGLWWRIGRRIGIGGVTKPAETKFLAEMLTAMLAERKTRP